MIVTNPAHRCLLHSKLDIILYLIFNSIIYPTDYLYHVENMKCVLSFQSNQTQTSLNPKEAR